MNKTSQDTVKKSLAVVAFVGVAGTALFAAFHNASNDSRTDESYKSAETLCKLRYPESAEHYGISQTSPAKIDVIHKNSVCHVTAQTKTGKFITFDYDVRPNLYAHHLKL